MVIFFFIDRSIQRITILWVGGLWSWTQCCLCWLTLPGSVTSASSIAPYNTCKTMQNHWLDQFENIQFDWKHIEHMQPGQPRCSQNGSHLLSLSLMSWVQLILCCSSQNAGNATQYNVIIECDDMCISCVCRHAQPHLCAFLISFALLERLTSMVPCSAMTGKPLFEALITNLTECRVELWWESRILPFIECRRHYLINCSVGSIEFGTPSSGTHLGANRNALFRLAACLCWAETYYDLLVNNWKSVKKNTNHAQKLGDAAH